jgi:acetyltransferase-like isoleucine patch superfamily enzyme
LVTFHIGKDCQIDPSAHIDVRHGYLGDGAVIRGGARIEGFRVEIGREAFLDRFATIGGGSCFDPGAFLKAGDWLHLGVSAQINTARGVTMGHEFGCGIETKIFTHGAYIDSFNLGAPIQWAGVEIGDNVWMPNAWVNPGVIVGSNVVVAARSLVNSDLPSGCLAGGVPAKILKENWLPRSLSEEERNALIEQIVSDAWARSQVSEVDAAKRPPVTYRDSLLISTESSGETVFHLSEKTIVGTATAWNLVLKDQLRRNGIRFRYLGVPGAPFKKWRDHTHER